jgi:transposase
MVSFVEEVAVFFRRKKSGNNVYLQIVENRWEEGASKQRVIATLGRLDELKETKQLDRLLASGARFSDSIMVIDAHSRGELPSVGTRRIGATLIFERLWKESGIKTVIKGLLAQRKFEFPVERVIFLAVLHRLFGGGSDRLCDKWADNYRVQGIDEVELHHHYRAMAWLGEELPQEQQTGHTFSPRCTKDLIEEELFSRTQDLFSTLDLVFFDTTSIYFEGEGGQSLGQRGHNKDGHPELKQMVVGAVIDGNGRPICCELWPGNTTDVTTLVPVANRLSSRFSVDRVCLVADRGMISKSTITDLEADNWPYILGARMRNQKEVREEVLSRAGRYQVVQTQGAPLKVKEVSVEGRRYVVCLNEAQAKKDAADREAIIAGLDDALKKGDKSLVGNKGYRRYLRTDGPHFQIDEDKIKTEVRYDGKWVLRTNTTLPAAEVALKYKQLWMVEQLFRTAKSLLETRPVFHKFDRTIRGHVFCSFLALVLRRALEDRLEKRGYSFEWADILLSLDSLTETELNHQTKTFMLRSDPKPICTRLFQAVGVAMPPVVRQIGEK